MGQDAIVMKPFLWLSIILLLTACGTKGPLITDCNPKPQTQQFICQNQANGKSSTLPASAVDNWIFVSAADERSIEVACAKGSGWPKVKACGFNAASLMFICFDEVSGQASTLPLSEAGNLIGVSPVDEQILLEFCQQLQELRKKKNGGG